MLKEFEGVCKKYPNRKHNSSSGDFDGEIHWRVDGMIKNLEKIIAPFYGWGSTIWRLGALWGGSLLFNTKLPEILATHFINLGAESTLEPPSGLEHGIPRLGIEHLNH